MSADVKSMRWMMSADVKTTVTRIVRKILDVDVVRGNEDLIDDLGADSLAIVELVLAAEDAFDINIPDDIYQKKEMRTVDGCVRYIEQRLASKGGGDL